MMNEANKSISPLGKKWRKFKSIKRGYYSLQVLIFCYLLSFILPLFAGRDALVVKFNGQYYFPVLKYYPASEFGMSGHGEANYRYLKKEFENRNSGDFVLMPAYPYGPLENLLDEVNGVPPTPPSAEHVLGTDDRARDVLSRLLYAFNTSLSFGIFVTLISFLIGTAAGALLGYKGGFFDSFGQRLIEIWSTLPFLFIVIIISSLFQPDFILLSIILTVFGWMGISYYVRAEVYREKSLEYVMSAYSSGTGISKILFRHIIPNSLTPVLSFAPFAVAANIMSLVSLDFLGFGLPPPEPSWGEMLSQGLRDMSRWWLVVYPLGVQFLTLLAIVFIGEGIRKAFDPKEYSEII
ncbi:MAG: ABC transporter permease subunit [Ignavibacteria bacterium]|jgi:microcin C transport system permease protein|nr:ABC transporter permease subunit [Ignavibacteria bacterium]